MGAIGIGVVVFVITLVLYMIVYFIGTASSKNRREKYQAYILQQFPYLQGQDFIMAAQFSMKLKPTIVLIIDNSKNNLIFVFEAGGKGFTHKIYTFASLKAVARTFQILSRGAMPKTYSYEETLALTLDDNSTYRFVIETISNKQGNDKAADFIKNIMAPWEQKLKALLPNVVPPPMPQ
jgi:hypothetical protein